MKRSSVPPTPRGGLSAVQSAVVVIAVAMATHLINVSNGYIGFDDLGYVANNPMLESTAGLADIWISNKSDQYYPLTFTTFWIEHHLFGDSAAGYHLTNVILHAANAVLLLWLLKRLGLSPYSALLAALLFAVHPVQVMSVAWIAQRKNLLSGFFVLLSALCWLKQRADGRRPISAYISANLFFAMALLSKSAVLLLPLVLIALDCLRRDRRMLNALAAAIPMLLLAAASAWITSRFEASYVANPLPISARPLIASAAIWFYGYSLALPLELVPIYPRWTVAANSLIWWIPPAALAVALGAIWKFSGIHRRAVSLAFVVFVAFQFPSLGFLPFGNIELTFVSDHYLYLAAIGPFVLVAVLLAGWKERSTSAQAPVMVISAITIAVLAALSVKQTLVYKDVETFWTATLKGNPDCYAAHAGLGALYFEKGRPLEAQPHLERATALRPDEVVPHLLLSFTLQQLGDLPGSLIPLETAAANQPQSTEVHRRLAATYLQLGNRARAAEAFEQVIRIDPNMHDAFLGLAQCQRGEKRFHEAIATLREGLSRAPDDIGMLNLMARILAASPDDSVRDGNEAVRLATRVCDLTAYTDWRLVETLGISFAEAGDFGSAKTTLERALRLAESTGNPAAVDVVQRIADEISAGRPLRESITGEIRFAPRGP